MKYKVSGVVVHTPTKKDWIKVVKQAFKDGYVWDGGDKRIDKEEWDCYGEESCVQIGFDNEEGMILYDRVSFYKKDYPQYPIISTQEYLDKFKTKGKIMKKKIDTKDIETYQDLMLLCLERYVFLASRLNSLVSNSVDSQHAMNTIWHEYLYWKDKMERSEKMK